MSTHQAEGRKFGNRLLDKLSGEELDALHPHLEPVSLTRAQYLIVPHEPILYAYFPITSLASLVTVLEDGSTVEAGAVGREGMVGVPILLDARTTPMETLVQIPGEAIRVKAGVIKQVFDSGGTLHDLLNRYIHMLFIGASQTAACNRRHQVELRLARWLLMSSDGVGSDEIALTQEFLATMLGVRRAGVTQAALYLQESGLIEYTRGRIRILDREKLEAATCECYHMVKEEFECLLG
ncbi:MAG TPA: Crp/Fnr family transcriptional regulator [Pyrinomonadaceae bacterium]|jgi:CRP-like cAMP-binding protein